MSEQIQVRDNVYTSPERLQIIRENGWDFSIVNVRIFTL